MAQESLSETPDILPDPSLSRSLSFSRLNAQAPEYVPTRPTARADLLQPRLIVPPPTSPFHLPIQGHVPVVQVQNHHHLTHQVHYRSHHHPQQYYVSSDSGLQQVQQSQVDPDHPPSSKTKLSDEAGQKILNQVNFSCQFWRWKGDFLILNCVNCEMFIKMNNV